MRTLSTILFICLLTLLFADTLHAQWIPTNGPSGGDVTCFVRNGTNLFAGTNGFDRGVYLSSDDGVTWTKTPDLDYRYMEGVECLATQGTNVFAGTGSGLWRSTDNGVSWDTIGGYWTVYSLAASGPNLFVGTGGDGVYRSTDSGANWAAVHNGWPRAPYDTSQILSAPSLLTRGTTIFAATGIGVVRSTNNGENWDSANTGLTGWGIVTLGSSGSSIFVGSESGLIFRSINDGASWVQVKSGGAGIKSITASGKDIYAGTNGDGVFKSTNDGLNWMAVNNGLTDLNVQALQLEGSNLFAGTRDKGVYVSADNGTNWTHLGLKPLMVNSLGSKGATLFAGVDCGLYISSDNGTNVAREVRSVNRVL